MSTNPTQIKLFKMQNEKSVLKQAGDRLGTGWGHPAQGYQASLAPGTRVPKTLCGCFSKHFPVLDYKAVYLGIWSLGASFSGVSLQNAELAMSGR